MKGVEKKLGIDPIETKQTPTSKEKIDDIKFNDFHSDDIKDDYKDSRKTLKKTIAQASSMANKIIDSLEVDDTLLPDENDTDKYLARKAEAFSRIIKCISDLNKDLMEIHTKYIELMIDEEDDEDEKENQKSKTFSDVKASIKKDLKLFGN